jgi:hypothetical protein
MRDIICKSNIDDTPLAIVSLDQAGAFDKIRHKYLFHTLERFGFGQGFTNMLSTLNKTQEAYFA